MIGLSVTSSRVCSSRHDAISDWIEFPANRMAGWINEDCGHRSPWRVGEVLRESESASGGLCKILSTWKGTSHDEFLSVIVGKRTLKFAALKRYEGLTDKYQSELEHTWYKDLWEPYTPRSSITQWNSKFSALTLLWVENVKRTRSMNLLSASSVHFLLRLATEYLR